MPDETTEPTTISWRVASPGTAVYGSDGERLGELREVAADENEDILHGLVVDRGGADPLVLIPRDDIVSIERDRIDVSVDAAEAGALPPYTTAGASASPLGSREA